MNIFKDVRDSSINGLMFKVILIGDNNVGKTSIIMRYLENKFSEVKTRTFGLDYKKKKIKKDGKEIIINFWDTAGHEEYRMITANFLKGSSAILVVTDISDKDSIEKLNEWKKIIDEYLDTNAVIYLLGNKNDLIENDNYPINLEEYKLLVENYNWNSFELVSAKSNFNLDEVFEKLCSECLNQVENDIRHSNYLKGSTLTKKNSLKSKENINQKKKCC